MKSDKTIWPITILKVREIWTKNIIPTFITLPELCPYCKKGKMLLRNNNSSVNPYLGKCNNDLSSHELY